MNSENETVSDNSDQETEETPQTVCSPDEAEQCIDKLKAFALAQGQSKMISNLMELTELATSLRTETCCQQTKISDYFKKC